MKTSVPIAISLTLLMFLLVLLAAFAFLFQGQRTLRQRLDTAAAAVETLQAEQAQTELNLSAAQATQTVQAGALATTEAERTIVESELVASDMQVSTLEAQLATLTADLDGANLTLQQYEAQGPLVSLTSPDENATFLLGQPVNYLVTASDVTGVREVTVSFGDDAFSTDGNNETTATVQDVWQPTTVGTFEMRVTAVNANGITSAPLTRTIFVIDPTPTAPAISTPLPES